MVKFDIIDWNKSFWGFWFFEKQQTVQVASFVSSWNTIAKKYPYSFNQAKGVNFGWYMLQDMGDPGIHSC